jgi:hypothetical protein
VGNNKSVLVTLLVRRAILNWLSCAEVRQQTVKVEMDSSIQCRFSHYLSEADEYYLKGKYDKCEHTLRVLREEVVATKSLSEICSMDKCMFSCIIENNILISKGLVSCNVYL